MKYVIIIIIIGALVVGMTYFMRPGQQSMKKVNFTTTDNQKIVANLFPVERPKGWLILIHMMPANKESWNDFAKEMQKLGYESLAIDLRGHGESEGGPSGFQKFSDAEHQASTNDAEAAWEFLKTRGAVLEKTVVIGASIGADLSIYFLAQHQDAAGGVFLSPGDYRGIDMGTLVKKLSPNQKILFVTSKKDNGNAEDNQRYYNLAGQVKNRHLIIFEAAGHGTDFFELKEEYDLTEAIKKFLEHGSIN